MPARKERVDAVELTPLRPGDDCAPGGASEPNTAHVWLWSGLAVLLLLVIAVIFLLPKAVDKNTAGRPLSQPGSDTVTPENRPAAPAPAVIQHAQQAAPSRADPSPAPYQARSEAEALLAELIALETTLQDHAVQKWAAEEYAQALEQGRLGDEYFRQRQYAQAIAPFKTAMVMLQTLQQRIQPTLTRALTRAEQALMQADEAAARQQFELARAIDSNNPRAINGLKRVPVIRQLFAVLQRAGSLESHGRLQQAKSAYQQALALDPQSQQAKSALARVENKLREQAFERMIAAGYQALQNAQYADARAAFNAAKTLSPNAEKPDLGLATVAQAVRREKIAGLLFEAEHFDALQQWPQAARSYEKILQLDSRHQAAQQGLAKSRAKAKLLAALNTALDPAAQLYRPEVLAQAENLLRQITLLESPGSMIEQQAVQLRQRVRVATTPVAIILESDNTTEVTVFKVARLGAFNKHQLQLRPGPYTIVGTRNGYRDVRLAINVSPQGGPAVITVRCEEPI